MSWLFVAQLRPFVLLAGAASLLPNLALLMPSIYMMQVFDRVFSSRSMETLVMLSTLAFLALGLAYCMDVVRARWVGRAARSIGVCPQPHSQVSCARPPVSLGGPIPTCFGISRNCARF